MLILHISLVPMRSLNHTKENMHTPDQTRIYQVHSFLADAISQRFQLKPPQKKCTSISSSITYQQSNGRALHCQIRNQLDKLLKLIREIKLPSPSTSPFFGPFFPAESLVLLYICSKAFVYFVGMRPTTVHVWFPYFQFHLVSLLVIIHYALCSTHISINKIEGKKIFMSTHIFCLTHSSTHHIALSHTFMYMFT
jgi:hypothetical protein